MCQVHTGAYVSLLAPEKTVYTACHPRKTTTYILHVVSITTHTHDRRKSIGKKKQRKEKKIKERKEKRRKRKKNRYQLPGTNLVDPRSPFQKLTRTTYNNCFIHAEFPRCLFLSPSMQVIQFPCTEQG